MPVYFIQNQNNKAIKIGWSENPSRRLADLQTASSETLVLLGSCPGGRDEEQSLHRDLAAHRILGEWFTPSAEVLKTVFDLVSMFKEDKVHRAYWMDHWELLVPRLNAIVSQAVGFTAECAWFNVGATATMAIGCHWPTCVKWRYEPFGHDFAYAWDESEFQNRFFDTPVEAAYAFIHAVESWKQEPVIA